MSQLIPFEFDSKAVRVVTDDNGNPWFVGKDICDVLGYSNNNDTIKKLCRADGVSNSYPTGLDFKPVTDGYSLKIHPL